MRVARVLRSDARASSQPRPSILTTLHRYAASLSRIRPLRHRLTQQHVAIPNAGQGAFEPDPYSPPGTSTPPGFLSGMSAHFSHLLCVYSDPASNSKLLVLVIGQALCSVATLIHDSYLPIYAQDVLGLSNTSVSACIHSREVCSSMHMRMAHVCRAATRRCVSHACACA